MSLDAAVHHVLPRSEEGRDVLPGEGWHGGGVASVVRRVAIMGSSWKNTGPPCHRPRNRHRLVPFARSLLPSVPVDIKTTTKYLYCCIYIDE